MSLFNQEDVHPKQVKNHWDRSGTYLGQQISIAKTLRGMEFS